MRRGPRFSWDFNNWNGGGVDLSLHGERPEWLDGVSDCELFGDKSNMSCEEALAAASRDEGFKATVYAMNALLIRKGVHTQKETWSSIRK
jgi:hypothetical protein